MPEQSKFSGALAKLNHPRTSQLPAPSVSLKEKTSRKTVEDLEVETIRRGKGRPPGKRSDPSFQPTTVLLRKATKRTAMRKLEDTDTEQDLSELIEHLLAQWIEQV